MESDRLAPSEGLLCTPCRLAAPEFARAVAYGVYENELREMIHLLKYDRLSALAKPLGKLLAEAILMLEREPEWSGDVTVVAVPLFSANQRERGFNQSVQLADEAIANLRRLRPAWRITPRHTLLRRVKKTESQFNLSPRGRRRNLEGAFKASDDGLQLMGRDVLLIDDIYTTGATARACSRVLRRAGAKRVWVATLARAQRERVALWDATESEFG
jgi:ComF family protein